MTAVAAPELPLEAPIVVVEGSATPPSPAVAPVQVQPPVPVATAPDPTAVAAPVVPAGTLLTGAPDPAAVASAPIVPETFALTLPEGSHLDPSALERISAVAKAIKLTSPEQAQAVLDAANAEVTAHLSALTAATAKDGAVWRETVKVFAKDALADPEIGGTPQQLERTVARGKQVLASYDTEGSFREFLDTTGYGSHPAVLKMFARLHHALGEDHFVAAGKPSAPPPKSLADRMFPNMTPE